MKITIKSVYDIETGQLISWDGYDYEGPVELACSSGGDVAAQDKAVAGCKYGCEHNLFAGR